MRFSVLMPAGIVAKLHPIIWSFILLWVFSYKFLQYFENTFFRTLVYNDFYWERFYSNYSRFFQRLSLHVKLAIK